MNSRCNIKFSFSFSSVGFIFVIFWCCHSIPALGSEKEIEDTWQVFHDAGMRTWQKRLLPEFRNVADNQTKEVLDETSFRVVRFSDFNAFSNRKKMEVIIPIGLIVTLFNFADAYSLAWVKPECVEKFKKYPNTLVDVYYRKLRGESEVYFKDFAEICKISKREASALREDQDVYNMKVNIVVDSLAFIVAHEIGHLVLNHKSGHSLTRSLLQKQEYDADAFGAKLASKAGFQPQGALFTSFWIFGLLESEDGTNNRDNHPPVSCRVDKLINRDELIDFPGSLDGLKRMGFTKEGFMKSLNDIHNLCVNALGGNS
ncbi:hypothetical protein PL263_03995 [Methylomonas sp. EFPC3]|uniref:hypothetical protein n=1 Tax=Methylomonas sp. EFPC3 TaxID=3021710 RepID=UPI00241755EF|nr:hypothetical protein [Methylomonas sp. EFPC3]WFP51194.1 hypothetical protein PL263_03995 [Methylomonas sp. EFPC3]